jgi:hypothetical protein
MLSLVEKGFATCLITITLIVSWALESSGQSNCYWTRSFNEESSLLSGAVVGGGSGPSAIYYNPASISEVEASKFSLNASLFSFDFINAKNALGDGIDLSMTRGKFEPRFISYMIKAKRWENWSFEIAILNNENHHIEGYKSVDEYLDVLTNIPGDERYFAYFQNENHFRDDWFGIGGSVKLNEKLYLGLSMFVTVKSLNFTRSLDIDAYPLTDSIDIDGHLVPSYIASYSQYEYVKFNDYRLTWKFGLQYKGKYHSFGLAITSPSVGGIYSDGKRVSRKEKQSNITSPETGKPIPDYVIVDYKEKKDVSVSYKTPFSIAAGYTYYFPDGKRIFYSSIEYFTGIEPFKMVEANESEQINPFTDQLQFLFSDWLTFVSGATQVLNAAVGYSWTLKEDLELKAGFRTDFNCKKRLTYEDLSVFNKVETLDMDLYHITCGLSWNILGQDIITGIQYTIGRVKDGLQIVNLSDPVEYNYDEHQALVGNRTSTLNTTQSSISIYFGASFNFGEDK